MFGLLVNQMKVGWLFVIQLQDLYQCVDKIVSIKIMVFEFKSMFELIYVLRDIYIDILLKVLKEVLLEIKYVNEIGKYIGKYYNFLNLFFNKNGLFSLLLIIGDGLIDY